VSLLPPAAVAKSEGYDRPSVSVGNTAPAVAPAIAPGAAIAAIAAVEPRPAPTPTPIPPAASPPPATVAPASTDKASVAPPSSTPISSAMSPTSTTSPTSSASASDDVDDLRRFTYIGHDQARLHGGRKYRLSEQHRCSRTCRKHCGSHKCGHSCLLTGTCCQNDDCPDDTPKPSGSKRRYPTLGTFLRGRPDSPAVVLSR
jgi:hypothetical protein